MDFKRSWKSLRKAAKLEDVTIHDLRRSLGSAMANENINVAIVKDTLGHADMKTTLTHYTHINRQASLAAKRLVHTKWEETAKAIAARPDSDNVVLLHGIEASHDNA